MKVCFSSRLRVAFLPMRLHLHQSQLDFLIDFFGGQNTSINPSMNAAHDMLEVGKEPKKTANLGGRTIVEEALLPYFQVSSLKLLYSRDIVNCSILVING